MREIKFRAWGKNSKEYLGYGTKDGISLTLKNIQNIEDLDSWIFEQYTGLKDKNGESIWEGDIVKMPDWQTSPKFEAVELAEQSCGFEPFIRGCYECWSPSGEEVEVVGNIHENPELLEEKK